MPTRRRARFTGSLTNLNPVVRLWMLRILVPLGGHREFVQTHGFNDDAVAGALGLERWADSDLGDFDLKAVRCELRELHREAEKWDADAELPDCLRNNVGRVSELVGLSDTDCRILEFSVLIHNERLLDDTADRLGALSSSGVFHALAVILDVPDTKIRVALSPLGVLSQSGLASVDRNGTTGLCGKLDLLSDDFADLMVSSDSDPVNLLRSTVSIAEPAELGIDKYKHIQADLDVLRPYLRLATTKERRGVNIFLYGRPGTGKSQLARTLAAEMGCDLFQVAGEDTDGDPVDGGRRLRAFRAAQSFFAQRRALIVFDEAEDVFDDGDRLFSRRSTAQVRKAWINRMLEENPVPTLWLSNSVCGLDPAFVRRFDMVFELPVPPKDQREQILRETCGDLLTDRSIARIAQSEMLAPAVVVRAGAVIRSVRRDLGQAVAPKALELLINNTLEAQGHPPLARSDPGGLPDVYDPAFIHANVDLEGIADGVVQGRSGRLCLYGPPGTGKTAFGRWLAARMGTGLLVKRASDLISKWVGESERNIAAAFREAERSGAVLLIDEVDGFLQDRRGAQHGWEVSQVNEMLAQMESFPGVFVATTNLMDDLDPAALRRFDVKAKFDFLDSNQAWMLLSRYCEQLCLPAPQPSLRACVARLPQLTPGDFAVALRQSRFRPVRSAATLVSSLEAECSVKEHGKARLGFV